MPNLPPPIWAELAYNGVWNDVTEDLRATTSQITVTRGLSSESSSTASPTSCTCDLDSRDDRYAPRNPASPLYGLIGRNTGFRWGYEVGSPWAAMSGAVTSQLATPDAPQLDVTDLDVRIDLAMEDWDRQCMLGGRYVPSGDNRCWGITRAGSGQIAFYWSPDGTVASVITQFSTAHLVAYHGQRLTLRITLDVNNGAGGYELCFYTGRTVDDTDWTPLGEPVVGTSTTTVYNGTAGIQLGNNIYLVGDPMIGRVYAFKLLNGINGTTAAHLEVSDAAPGATSFTSHGLTWTVQGGVTLTNRHVRMAGEVPAWPPTRDLSGNDNYVSINPSGLMRRMDAGNRPQDSALLRFIKSRGPVECWPLTDGPRTTGAKSLVGGQDMQAVRDFTGTDTPPDWQAGSLADWIEPVLSAKANTTGGLRGGLPRTAGTDAAWSVDVYLSGGGTPSSGRLLITDRGAGTDDDNRIELTIIFDGVGDGITATYSAWGDEDFTSGLLGTYTSLGLYTEDPHHLRLRIVPASSSQWYLYMDGQLLGSGTIPGITVKSAEEVQLGWGFSTLEGVTMSDRSFGYVTYWDGSGPSAAEVYEAYMGYQGERAGKRIERLATEAGYTASVAGEATFQQLMGIQGQKRLLELLTEAARTDFGYLLDARDRIEVIHRGGSTLWNQPPALVLDYSAGLISPPFRPVDDDRLTENDVSVKREYGSVPAREVLEEGPLSVLPPEDGGVGRYDTSHTYSLYTDDQAAQVAGMRLHLGTYAGVRYTRLTLNLANSRVYEHIDDILRLDVGDKIRLTNLPPDHGPDDVDVLVAGYTEEAGPDGWTITFNCLPGAPWTAAVVDSFTSHVDTDGSELAAAVDADDTSVSIAVTAGPLWTSDPSDTPFDLRIGGEVMAVLAPGVLVNAEQNPFFDTGIDGWSAESAALSWSTAVVHPHPRARGSLLITPAGGAATFAGVVGTLSGVGSVTPGTSYVMSAWVYSPGGWSDIRPSIYWYSSTGTFLSTSAGSALSAPAGQWTCLQATYTAPASASQARARLRHGNTPAPTDVLYVWAARITPASAGTGPQTFTVARAQNGVAKAHAAGTDVRLANPVYVAM
jgi:hypothetical protein